VKPGPARASRTALVVSLAVTVTVGLSDWAGAQLAAGPPPTPVPPDGSLSPFPQVLNTPADPISAPELSAASAILVDQDSGQVLFAEDADEERAIASLTKIMTGLLVLERTDLSEVVTVTADSVILDDDRSGIAALGLEEGEQISVRDLLYALLLQSANDAAVALADHVDGSVDRFVKRMNTRALRLGMRHTRFYSPNGLDDRGYSTARDLAILTRVAMATAGFSPVAATRSHTIPAPDGVDREIQNRDALLWLYPGATGVKTGFTSRAGFCVVATAEQDGRRLVAVVLGAPSDAFSDAAALLNHGFSAFTRHTFAMAGEPAGVVTLAGGSVEVESGGDLEALVLTAAIDRAQEQIVVREGAAYPPTPGERVASLKVTIPGLTVGRVPLVVSSVPPPPPIEDGPWWERVARTVAAALTSAFHAVTG
jgi:D-alanyl-D-alanine carboxypeptidase (penicillin-binding protein 5/6)